MGIITPNPNPHTKLTTYSISHSSSQCFNLQLLCLWHAKMLPLYYMIWLYSKINRHQYKVPILAFTSGKNSQNGMRRWDWGWFSSSADKFACLHVSDHFIDSFKSHWLYWTWNKVDYIFCNNFFPSMCLEKKIKID